jgi:NAD-dependent deacetylase
MKSIRSYRSVVVFTGAGLSSESGIPTYRGQGGIWSQYRWEEYACQQAFDRDPEKVWDFHDKRRAAVAACEPNAGHRIIAEMEAELPRVTVVTQNIDGLHQRAGSSPELVVELHGTMFDAVCLDCGDRRPMREALDRVVVGEADPSCRSCGGILKSATISFGQSLDPAVLSRGRAEARGCDLLLAAGTSLTVHPAAGLVNVAVRAGATLVVCNASATQYDSMAQAVLREPLGEVLPALMSREPT